MTALQLETRNQPDETGIAAEGRVSFTPPIDEDYWQFRVALSPRQAIVGFPKFMTIGVGFAVEDAAWNVNLPFTCDADEIYDHIARNKGADSITREDCLTAIRLIQNAAAQL